MGEGDAHWDQEILMLPSLDTARQRKLCHLYCSFLPITPCLATARYLMNLGGTLWCALVHGAKALHPSTLVVVAIG